MSIFSVVSVSTSLADFYNWAESSLDEQLDSQVWVNLLKVPEWFSSLNILPEYNLGL